MPLDPLIFRRQFVRFERRVLHNSEPNEPFVSFREGFPDDVESYKIRLRTIARDRLGFDRWLPADVGSGKILELVINAIEIRKGQSAPRNNLVAWQARYGPEDVAHRALLNARTDRSSKREFETWFFEFFRRHLKPNDAFESFIDIAGRRYDLVAYLFFLRDVDKYMPIATKTFDMAFDALGIPLKTSQQCSWDNYSRYNAALAEIRDALRDVEGVRNARLIDAHSFCWILVRNAFDIREVADPEISTPISLRGMKRPTEKTGRSPNEKAAPVIADDFFLMRSEAQHQLGRLAENIAIQSEQLRLLRAGRTALANAIRSVSNQPALGYDIQSFELDGTDRHIEVKAARYSKGRFDFFVTKNEVAKSRKLPNYHFYLVVNAKSQKPAVFDIEADEVHADCLSPINYSAALTRPG
jgi:hypothetical protein